MDVKSYGFARITDVDRPIFVKLSYLAPDSVIKAIWDIPNLEYLSNGRWFIPNTQENQIKLVHLGLEPEGQWDMHYGEDCVLTTETPYSDIDQSILHPSLYPYQIDGVRFLEAVHGRGILGDEMGLGKTPQVCSWLKLHPEMRPALIIAPASIQLNWIQELKKWADIDAELWTKRTDSDVCILSYDLLRTRIKDLVDIQWKAIITDECQYLMNRGTQRWKAFFQIANTETRIAVSGTPIKSRTSEFFSILNWVHPGLFPNLADYHREYCTAKPGWSGMEFKGSKNMEQLNRKLKPVMVRRKKVDVLPQLPPKRKNIVSLSLEDTLAADYWHEDDAFMEWVEENKTKILQAKSHLAVLAHKAYLAKRNSLIDWIDNFLDSTEEKLVLFAYHRKVIEDLQNIYGDTMVTITGDTSSTARQEAKDAFQAEGGPRIFLGQILAASTGITLTRASNVAFVQMWWNPSDMEQAEDRVHRISQEADSVNVWYLTAAGTIEDDQAYALQEKQCIVSKVLDGEEQDFFQEDFIHYVLRRRRKNA